MSEQLAFLDIAHPRESPGVLWGGFDKDVDVLDAGANEPIGQHGWRPIDSIYTRDGDKVKNAADDIVTNLDELGRAEARRKSSIDL